MIAYWKKKLLPLLVIENQVALESLGLFRIYGWILKVLHFKCIIQKRTGAFEEKKMKHVSTIKFLKSANEVSHILFVPIHRGKRYVVRVGKNP